MRTCKSFIAVFALSFIVSAPALAFDAKTTSTGFGCIDKSYAEKLLNMAINKDHEALGKAVFTGIMAGTCIMLKEGEIVDVTERDISLKKLRRHGETTEYWSNVQSVAN